MIYMTRRCDHPITAQIDLRYRTRHTSQLCIFGDIYLVSVIFMGNIWVVFFIQCKINISIFTCSSYRYLTPPPPSSRSFLSVSLSLCSIHVYLCLQRLTNKKQFPGGNPFLNVQGYSQH